MCNNHHNLAEQLKDYREEFIKNYSIEYRDNSSDGLLYIVLTDDKVDAKLKVKLPNNKLTKLIDKELARLTKTINNKKFDIYFFKALKYLRSRKDWFKKNKKVLKRCLCWLATENSRIHYDINGIRGQDALLKLKILNMCLEQKP